jgi:DNA-directed RNA polymerase subunit N (RpoN/RPB10)
MATTQRLMPLVCFNCAMPLNNKQVAFDVAVDAGAPARELFDRMYVSRLCCKIALNTAAVSPQLDGRQPPKPRRCAHVTSMPLAEGPAVTLSTDGSTAPLAQTM